MASEIITSKPVGYIAFDIERTGGTKNDITFAIGIAHGTKNSGISTLYSDISTLKIILDLGANIPFCHDSNHGWEQFWMEKGYEMRCWEQFWCNNESVLHELQSNPTVSSEEELAFQFNLKIKEIEENYSNVIVITDNVMYDTVWLNELLTKYGYTPLNYTRQGKYRWGYEIDSLIEGSLGLDGNENWQLVTKLRKENIDTLLPELGATENNHDPEDDARHILATYFRVREYNLLKNNST